MLDEDDLWLMDEPSELLRGLPEIRHCLDPDRREEAGLRSVLERPEALSKAWRRRHDLVRVRT